jgi:hypothetical protein
MWTCEVCGAESKDTYKLCHKCGSSRPKSYESTDISQPKQLKPEPEQSDTSATDLEPSVKCGNCGVHLDTDAKFCPSCSTPVVSANLPSSCTRCGKQVNKESKFCKHCAFDLGAHISIPNSKSTAKLGYNKRRLLLFLLILGIGFTIVLFLRSFNSYQSSYTSRPSTRETLFDSGKLTEANAQRALTRWISNYSGTVIVEGIQEVPQENIARVSVRFSNFRFRTNYQGERNYSGPGSAIFTHYNDGRWVLTNASTSQGFGSALWSDINIEAR